MTLKQQQTVREILDRLYYNGLMQLTDYRVLRESNEKLLEAVRKAKSIIEDERTTYPDILEDPFRRKVIKILTLLNDVIAKAEER